MRRRAFAAVLLSFLGCRKPTPPVTPTHSAMSASASAGADTLRRDSIAFAKEVAAYDSAQADSARRDSASFAALADSMSALESRLVALRTDTAAAPLLLQLGKLKARAIDWMIGGEPSRHAGFAYAKAHDQEFGYFDPDGRYYYNGLQWRQLLNRFPHSSLADSARWYLAHLERGHGD